MALQDGSRAVQLLRDNHPDQFVRQGQRAETPSLIGHLNNCLAESVRTADDKCAIARSQSPRIEPAGELLGTPGTAAQVQERDCGARRYPRKDPAGLLVATFRGRERLPRFADFAFLDIHHPAEPAEVVVTRLAECRPKPADSDEVQLHQAYSPRIRCIAATRSMPSM